MAGAIIGLMTALFVGLGIGIGGSWLFWRNRRHQLEAYIEKIELSREDKVDRYQASLQRIKERETKIGELRKEIYHKEQIIRDLSRRSKEKNREGNGRADSLSAFVY